MRDPWHVTAAGAQVTRIGWPGDEVLDKEAPFTMTVEPVHVLRKRELLHAPAAAADAAPAAALGEL